MMNNTIHARVIFLGIIFLTVFPIHAQAPGSNPAGLTAATKTTALERSGKPQAINNLSDVIAIHFDTYGRLLCISSSQSAVFQLLQSEHFWLARKLIAISEEDLTKLFGSPHAGLSAMTSLSSDMLGSCYVTTSNGGIFRISPTGRMSKISDVRELDYSHVTNNGSVDPKSAALTGALMLNQNSFFTVSQSRNNGSAAGVITYFFIKNNTVRRIIYPYDNAPLTALQDIIALKNTVFVLDSKRECMGGLSYTKDELRYTWMLSGWNKKWKPAQQHRYTLASCSADTTFIYVLISSPDDDTQYIIRFYQP